MKIRPTITLRLTLVYGLLLAATAIALIAVSYLFVESRTEGLRREGEGPEAVDEILERAGVSAPVREAAARAELPGELATAIDAVVEENRQQFLDDLLEQSVLAALLIAIPALLAAAWAARRALRPVDELAAATDRLSDATLDTRLADQGPDDELARLRRSFNEMLDRLEAGFDRRRRFAADASHELRTPLATLRARADNELARAEVGSSAAQLAADVVSQVDRAEQMVASLLALARVEESSPDLTEVDLADVVGEVTADTALAADDRGIVLELELDDAPVVADRFLLTAAVANLIRNAVAHNVDGGTAWIRVTAGDHTGRLTVENTGPEVTAAEVDAWTDRFARGQSSGGHGLGLPLVRAVAESHHATLDLRPRSGGGLTAELRVPRR